MTSRLEALNKSLTTEFCSADISRQRQATIDACMLAVKNANLDDYEVAAALEFLIKGEGDRKYLENQMQLLASKFDDNYLALDESGESSDSPQLLCLFSKARAASALRFALSDDTYALQEGIYEAFATSDDPSEIENVVRKALI